MVKKFYNEEELVFAEKSKDWKFEDLDSQIFERLIVIGFAGVENRRTLWFCKCRCGNITKVRAEHLKNGNTTSCGCFGVDRTKEVSTTHGHTINRKPTPTYKTWCCMLARCRNHSNADFPYYGGRGIEICDRWLKFENFLADMGERRRMETIERVDNNGNYEPGNCRWATRKEQNSNKRSNRFLTLNGKKQSVMQWADEIGVKPKTIYARIDRHGWSIEMALTTKVGGS